MTFSNDRKRQPEDELPEPETGEKEQIVGRHISGIRPKSAPTPDFSSSTRVRHTDEGRYFLKPGSRDTIPECPDALLYAEAMQHLLQEGREATHENVSAVMNALREFKNRENPDE